MEDPTADDTERNEIAAKDTDDTTAFVVDPDDYQRTRKLMSINKAKTIVHDLRRDKPKSADSKEWTGIHARISEAVAMYGHELLPLIEDAQRQGLIDDDDLQTEHGDLRKFIRYDGRLPDHEEEEIPDPIPPMYMGFYRQLERIERKLGLGLDLKEDTDEWEI